MQNNNNNKINLRFFVRETNPSWCHKLIFGDVLIDDKDQTIIGIYNGTRFVPVRQHLFANDVDIISNLINNIK